MKPTPNHALKVAIVRSEISQREIARLTKIPETRLSHIVRGRSDATESERKALARVLQRSADELFPSETGATA